MTWKDMVYHINKSDIGYMHLKQQQKKNTQTNIASPSKNAVKKNNKDSSKVLSDNTKTWQELDFTE